MDDNKSHKSSKNSSIDDLKSVKVEKQIKVPTTNIVTNEEPKIEQQPKNEESKETVNECTDKCDPTNDNCECSKHLTAANVVEVN